MTMTIQELTTKLLNIQERCTKTDIFFSYSPHVNWLCVQCHWDGWKEETSADFSLSISIDNEGAVNQEDINILFSEMVLNRR